MNALPVSREHRTLGGCPAPSLYCCETPRGQRFSEENLQTRFSPCQESGIAALHLRVSAD